MRWTLNGINRQNSHIDPYFTTKLQIISQTYIIVDDIRTIL